MMAGRADGGTGGSGDVGPKGVTDADTWRELGPIVVAVALAVAVLAGLAVLPARTWWTQRQNMNDARSELMRVESEVAQRQADLDLLQTDAEVERLARRDFDLVFPGEESYRLVPPTSLPSSPLSSAPLSSAPLSSAPLSSAPLSSTPLSSTPPATTSPPQP